MLDLLFISTTLGLTFLGAYISTGIKTGSVSVYFAPLVGILLSFLWLAEIKFSKIPIVTLSTISNVLITVGFFLGFVLLGQQVTPCQWLALILITIGIILMNF